MNTFKAVFHSAKKSEQTEILPRFVSVHVQFKHDCAISENRAEKVGRKKVEKFQLSWRIFSAEILIANQILFLYQQLFSTWLPKTRRHVKLIQDFLTML